MISYPFRFEKIEGLFLERVNRFVIKCEVGKEQQPAYLPNPGRLWELLHPGVRLILKKNPNSSLPYSAIFCFKDDKPVLLHTHVTNQIIKSLIANSLIPFYKGYTFLKSEIRHKRSRFDLLLSGAKGKLFLEVKTCTLFGKKTEMFPDAVSERASKHIRELKELSDANGRGGVLFAVMNPEIKYFLPAFHVDMRFSETLWQARNDIDVNAVALGWDRELTVVKEVKPVKILWDETERHLADKGCYMLIIRLDKGQNIQAGSLNPVFFKEGYYIYVGSAKANLSKRIARHLRKTKQKHWHIDYLLEKATVENTIPIVTHFDMECFISSKLSETADGFVSRFGSSDCNCKSHLYFFGKNPLKDRRFTDLITFLRTDALSCFANFSKLL